MRNTNKRKTNYSKENVMFFLSSRSTEKSLETPRQTGFKNSLFTVFLERGLRGGADTNKERVITAKEIYNFVHQGVVETMPKWIPGKQNGECVRVRYSVPVVFRLE